MNVSSQRSLLDPPKFKVNLGNPRVGRVLGHFFFFEQNNDLLDISTTIWIKIIKILIKQFQFVNHQSQRQSSFMQILKFSSSCMKNSWHLVISPEMSHVEPTSRWLLCYNSLITYCAMCINCVHLNSLAGPGVYSVNGLHYKILHPI